MRGAAVGLLFVMAATWAPNQAVAAKALYVRQCENSAKQFSDDEQIAGCTTAIRSGRFQGKNLAFAYVDRGNAYYRKKDFDRAFADFDNAIRLAPNVAAPYNGRGNSYNNKKDYDHAIADYSEAMRLAPKEAIAYNNRGNAYIKKEDYDRALADLNEAIRLDPAYVLAYNNRGNAYYGKKDYDRAIADYNESIRLDPNAGRVYNYRANAYFRKNDFDRAIADYDQTIRLEPNDASVYRNRGLAFSNKKDYGRAIADYDQAIRIEPNYDQAYRSRGNAYEARKDYAHAIADFSEAIRLAPGNATYYNDRCWDRALVGADLNGALSDCNEALRLQPNDGDILNSRGLVQFKLGAFDLAIADYNAAIAQNSKDAGSLYARGVAKLKKGDTAGGNADIAAAKTIQADIAAKYAGYGVTPDGKTAAITPAAILAPDAQLTYTQWTKECAALKPPRKSMCSIDIHAMQGSQEVAYTGLVVTDNDSTGYLKLFFFEVGPLLQIDQAKGVSTFIDSEKLASDVSIQCNKDNCSGYAGNISVQRLKAGHVLRIVVNRKEGPLSLAYPLQSFAGVTASLPQ